MLSLPKFPVAQSIYNFEGINERLNKGSNCSNQMHILKHQGQFSPWCQSILVIWLASLFFLHSQLENHFSQHSAYGNDFSENLFCYSPL